MIHRIHGPPLLCVIQGLNDDNIVRINFFSCVVALPVDWLVAVSHFVPFRNDICGKISSGGTEFSWGYKLRARLVAMIMGVCLVALHNGHFLAVINGVNGRDRFSKK